MFRVVVVVIRNDMVMSEPVFAYVIKNQTTSLVRDDRAQNIVDIMCSLLFRTLKLMNVNTVAVPANKIYNKSRIMQRFMLF